MTDAGNIADVLYGASLLPNLDRLHLVDQGLYGTLPSSGISFPKLTHIDLGYNDIQVPLASPCCPCLA